MKHQKYPAAYKALLSMRGEPVLAAKEMLYVHYQMDVEMRHLCHKRLDTEDARNGDDGQTAQLKDGPARSRFTQRIRIRSGRGINYWQKLGQLFSEKRVRRAMGTAIVCMIGQQLCGVSLPSTI
jgi:hypothetical protein